MIKTRRYFVGGEDGHRRSKIFPTRIPIRSAEERREQLMREREMWESERALEEEVLDFREIQEAYFDGLTNLDEMLEDMLESGLCKRLSVWKNR